MANQDSKPHGRIYLITNTANGKQYVGQTTGSISKRWAVHCHSTSKCSALHAAIAKYGAAGFKVEELATADSQRELNALEHLFVLQYGSLAPSGYNLRDGGGSKGKWSEQKRAEPPKTKPPDSRATHN